MITEEIERIVIDALSSEQQQDAIATALDSSDGGIPAVHRRAAEELLDQIFYELSELDDRDVAALWVEEGCPEPKCYEVDPYSSTPAQDAIVQGLYERVTLGLSDEDLLRLLEESLCETQSGFGGFRELMMDLVALATDAAVPYYHVDLYPGDVRIPVSEPGVVVVDCFVSLSDSTDPYAAYEPFTAELRVSAGELVRLARGEVSTDEYAGRVRAAIAEDLCLGQEEIA